MSMLQIALLAVVVLLIAWFLTRRRAAGTDPAMAERLDTLTGWPPQASRVLTTSERLAFSVLVRALPEYMVLAQVPLARFVSVPKRNSYADWLRRLGYQCADFVVCDMTTQVIAVVELHAEQTSERAHKRLTRMSRTLKAAKIPLHVWSEKSLPSVESARDALLPRSTPAPTAPAASAAPVTVPIGRVRAAAPVAAVNPFEDTDRDSTHDELIEPLEPPLSTWFDDLDSTPGELGKR